jgi:MFS transporter, ceroid-lipofuscinosis neuronal protein 7
MDDAERKQPQILETEAERRTRLLSLKIIYFTMFLMTLGFSIILTGIWPFLDKVGRSKVAAKTFQ